MSLLPLIVVATVCYALFDFFAAQSGGRIDANLGSVIFNGIGTAVPIVVYAFVRLRGAQGLVPTQTAGIVHSVLAGVSIAVFSILLVKIFESGSLPFVMPLIYGGAIVIASLLGRFALGESIGRLHLVGLLLVAAGIATVVASSASAN